jgi:multiple sugar transport system substrate-binding protein
MKNIRIMTGVGVVALAASLITGCGSTEGGSGEGPEPVVFWGSWSGDQVAQLDEQAAAFNASQDEYEVTYVAQELVEEKLLTAIAGGQVPDVVLWDRPATAIYAPKGALMSLDELVERDGVDMGQFYQQATNELIVDDKLYGLPLLVDNRSLFYNTAQLAEAGVEPPTTWDELRAAAETLTVRDGGTLTRAGFALSDPGLFASWLGQAGGRMLSEDGETVAFNSPEGLEVLDFWTAMLGDGSYELGFGEGTDPFAEGTVSMKYDGPWALSGLDATDVEYGIVPPVAGPGGDQAAGMGGFGLVIPEGAKNTEGAWEFLKWWTTQPESGVGFAKIAGWIPANIEAANDPYFTENPHYAAFIETLEFAKTRPQVTGYSDVEGKALIPSLQKFLSGELTAQQALDEAEELSNQILAENR